MINATRTKRASKYDLGVLWCGRPGCPSRRDACTTSYSWTPIKKPRRGFSLVELLVVLAIVAILAALIGGALWHAGVTAREHAIVMEINGLDMAVKEFQNRFGDAPPDFTDPAALDRFLHRAFPRCPAANYPDFTDQGPASALYFWLAGPNGDGFSANPQNPFDASPSRIKPLFDFDPGRLKKSGNATEYFPPSAVGSAPYVYFKANNGYDGHPGWPPARPYRDTRSGRWINPDSFQIVSGGMDGRYGAGNQFPTGDDYDAANYDDLANFSGGGTLEHAMP